MQAYVSDPYEKYRQQGVMSASPVELIVMLYDGCIKQIHLAQRHIEKNEIEAANTSMQKAQAIISELSMSLDRSYDVSASLSDLYDFILETLVSANLDKDIEKLESLVGILTELKEAWETLAKDSKKNRYVALEG